MHANFNPSGNSIPAGVLGSRFSFLENPMTTTVNEAVKQKSAEGLVCVTLEVHLWSGRKRLKKEQLIAKYQAFEDLPPATLATLGSIKICDTDDLAPFNAMKREAEKLLAINGLPLLGTTGIPEGKLENVYKGLALIQAKFNDKRDTFFKRFDSAIEDWRNQPENSEWSNLIHDIPSPEQAAGKMSFGFHLCRVSAPSTDEFSDANRMYAKQMTGLKGELFADAAKEAEILITKYLIGKSMAGVVQKREKVTWKTLRPLKRIGEKFTSFSFLDPTCEPMADMIDHVLGLLPDEGPIEGVNLMHIWTLAQALSNPQKAISLAQMAFEAESSADAFENLLGERASAPAFAEPAAIAVEVAPATEIAAAIDCGFFQIPTEHHLQENSNEFTNQADALQEQPSFVALF